jgi:nicotinate-nucleotide adenylyltransferase
LLGGSFNPAHEGHRYISELALKQLQLHQVWWVISPQNPLKASNEIAPLEERCAIAKLVARHPQIRVTDIEDRIGTSHTIDTITVLQARFPDVRFVWLMGADILLELPQWKRWRDLFHRVPIAVYPRPSYSLRAMSSPAARSFAGARVPERQARRLADMRPPAWTFLQVRPNSQSATRIRAQRPQSSGGRSRAAAEDQEDQTRRKTRLSPETQPRETQPS